MGGVIILEAGNDLGAGLTPQKFEAKKHRTPT